jgi:hypothetical protein
MDKRIILEMERGMKGFVKGGETIHLVSIFRLLSNLRLILSTLRFK